MASTEPTPWTEVDDNDTLEGGMAPTSFTAGQALDCRRRGPRHLRLRHDPGHGGRCHRRFQQQPGRARPLQDRRDHGRRRRCLFVDHHRSVWVPPPYLLPGRLCYDFSNGILYGFVGNAGTSAAPNFAITVGLGISWGTNATSCSERSANVLIAAGPDQAATPSFFCRLVEEVVYWNRSFFSGYT